MALFKLKTKKVNKEKKLPRSIGYYIFLNAIILLVFSFVIRIYYVDNTKKVVSEKYHNILYSNFDFVEKEIRSIINSVTYLKNSDFDGCMSYHSEKEPENSQIAQTIALFQDFTQNYDILDSTMIINHTLDVVISNEGKYDLEKFLKENYVYSDYPYKYWKSYKAPLYHIGMLPPSRVKTAEAGKTIIPIVFSSVKDIVSSNLLVVNISADKIFEQPDIVKNLTQNSRFYIVSNYDKAVFHTDAIPKPEEDFIKFISGEKIQEDGYSNYKDKKYGEQLIIRYAPTSHILGYEYIITIPINDIPDIRSVKQISNFIMFVMAALIIGWIIMGRTKIIKPVEEIEFSAKKYKQDADNMIPIVREKYVSDIINSPLPYIDGYVSDILAKSHIAFRHNNFLAIIVRYTVDMAEFSSTEVLNKENIIAEMNLELKLILSRKYEIVNVCLNDESLYVISMENADEKKNAVEEVEKFAQSHTTNAILLQIGTGEVFNGHLGIKKSVETANYDLIKCIQPDEVKRTHNPYGKNKYLYSKQDDDKLFNMLVAGYTDETMKHVSEIIRKNIENGISETAQKELYRQMLNTVTRVMDMKDVDYKSSSQSSSIDFIVQLLEKEHDEIYKIIMKCINEISSHTTKYNTKLDFSKIIRYIDEHYAEDIYLDIIALHFGTSSKYLSRKLKQHLGMNFHKYLTQIRINHAKILITSTDMKIEEIGQNVGYMSNTTFVRAFKSETGLSPAVYKKQQK